MLVRSLPRLSHLHLQRQDTLALLKVGADIGSLRSMVIDELGPGVASWGLTSSMRLRTLLSKLPEPLVLQQLRPPLQARGMFSTALEAHTTALAAHWERFPGTGSSRSLSLVLGEYSTSTKHDERSVQRALAAVVPLLPHVRLHLVPAQERFSTLDLAPHSQLASAVSSMEVHTDDLYQLGCWHYRPPLPNLQRLIITGYKRTE